MLFKTSSLHVLFKTSAQNFVCQIIPLGHKILIWDPEGSWFQRKILIFCYSTLASMQHDCFVFLLCRNRPK